MWQRELSLVLCGDRGVRWKGGWGEGPGRMGYMYTYS